jgi:hypothetical protein
MSKQKKLDHVYYLQNLHHYHGFQTKLFQNWKEEIISFIYKIWITMMFHLQNLHIKLFLKGTIVIKHK